MHSPHPARAIKESAPRGYVLLLVLFVLALAAAALTGICRKSLEKAVAADRAQSDLRQRWGVISCQNLLLPRAEDLLLRSNTTANQIRRSITLNGQSLTLIFSDEQAKANVNLIFAQTGLSQTERQVRTIVGLSGGFVPVELRPIPGAGQSFGSVDANDDDPRAFETLDQLMPGASPDLLINPHGTRWSIASRLTCWGDGSLNFSRAPDESVRAVLDHHLPAAQINQLLDARAKDPKALMADILDTLALPDARRQAVESILGQDSACHSLWIISDSGDRIRYDLAVSQGAVVTVFK